MPRLQFLVFLIILSCLLTGCSLSLPPPSAPKLMAVFTEPFLCGFTFYEPDAKPLQASLVRNEAGDLLTVYGEHVNTVFFHHIDNVLFSHIKIKHSTDMHMCINNHNSLHKSSFYTIPLLRFAVNIKTDQKIKSGRFM